MSRQIRRLMFSREAYHDMFRMRAKGASYQKIADTFHCSDVFIAEVIKKKTRQEETAHVPPKLVEKAQSMGMARSNRQAVEVGTPKPKAPKKNSYPDFLIREGFNALSRLMEAKEAVVVAKRRCDEALKACYESGLSEAFIELALEEAERVQKGA